MHRRERTAYQQFVPALGDRAPQLLGHDDELRTLVTTVLPGEVVRGHRSEHSPQVHRQAGGLYRVLHGSAEPTTDPSYTAGILNRTRRWLDSCRELVKMQLREWLERPELEEAFLDGYGHRPGAAEEAFMAASRAQEAIGIIWWSHHHDDPAFAAAGHRALQHVLERPEVRREVPRQRADGPSASPPPR